ncbi:MAG: OmpH family outer membrane protein [Planctomycetota bacterium]|nr:OmpH family outer membrane protein [Planctomycetota bacterium]
MSPKPVLAFFAICLLLFSGAVWAQEAPADPGFRVGFVNVKVAFEGFGKTRFQEKQINAWFREQMRQIEEEGDRLKKLAEEIELFAPRSPERQKQEKEYFRKKMMLDFRKKSLQDEVQKRLKTSTEGLYEEVNSGIADYARKHGFTIIFKVDGDSIASDSQSELKLKIHTRGVVYYDPKLDITNAVVAALNESFQGKTKKESAGDK